MYYDRFLGFNKNSCFSECYNHGLFIDRFQKPASEFVDYIKCAFNDSMRQFHIHSDIILFILYIHVNLFQSMLIH